MDYLTEKGKRFSTPEISYPRPVSQPGLNSLGDDVRRVHLGPSTLTSVQLSKPNDATQGTGGGQIISFRIPQGSRALQDFRSLTLRAVVTVATASGHVIPCSDMISGHIAQLRIKAPGVNLFETSYYNNLVQGCLPLLSTDTIRQMSALAGYGRQVSAGSYNFEAPLFCPLSYMSTLWPGCLVAGPLEVEIQIITGGGALCGTSAAAATITYTDYELIYDEVAISEDLFNDMRNQFIEAGRLVLSSLGWTVARGSLSIGATSSSIAMQARRCKGIYFFETLAAGASGASYLTSRSRNGVSSWNVQLNGLPVYPTSQRIGTQSSAQTLYDLFSAVRDVKDYWRGYGGYVATPGAPPAIVPRTPASFAGDGVASYDNGPLYVVSEETIRGNTKLGNNSIEIRAPVVFVCDATTAAAALYMSYVNEVIFVISPDGSLSSE